MKEQQSFNNMSLSKYFSEDLPYSPSKFKLIHRQIYFLSLSLSLSLSLPNTHTHTHTHTHTLACMCEDMDEVTNDWSGNWEASSGVVSCIPDWDGNQK